MIIHDQHVHSYYSFDSEQRIEEYLEKTRELGLSYFVLTDHCDLNYLDKGDDIFFSLENQEKELNLLQTKYKDIKLLKGIEIGYKQSELERIYKIINSTAFDLINFSLHESDQIDYYFEKDFEKRGIKETLKLYFLRELEAVTNFNDYDVFCHIDYGFKTAYLADKSLRISDYKETLTKILKTIIKNNKALEINVKVQSVMPKEHTVYLFTLYKKLGGKYLTLSSDAHQVSDFRKDFDKYITLIKTCGFTELVYFVNRKKHLFKIPIQIHIPLFS